MLGDEMVRHEMVHDGMAWDGGHGTVWDGAERIERDSITRVPRLYTGHKTPTLTQVRTEQARQESRHGGVGVYVT